MLLVLSPPSRPLSLLSSFLSPSIIPRKLKKQPSSPPLRSLTQRDSDEDEDDVDDDDALPPPPQTTAASPTSAANVVAANPLFANNPAFASVLADSLNRQGSEALVSGEARSAEEEFDKEGPIEEVLASCLRDQRQAVVQLENLEKVVKQALEREKKQFERLQFAFKKAGNDRAYAQSLAKLRKR